MTPQNIWNYNQNVSEFEMQRLAKYMILILEISFRNSIYFICKNQILPETVQRNEFKVL